MFGDELMKHLSPTRNLLTNWEAVMLSNNWHTDWPLL